MTRRQFRVIVCDAAAVLYSRRGIKWSEAGGSPKVRREGEQGREAEAGAGTRAETGTPVARNRCHIILFPPASPGPDGILI